MFFVFKAFWKTIFITNFLSLRMSLTFSVQYLELSISTKDLFFSSKTQVEMQMWNKGGMFQCCQLLKQ